MHTTTKSKLKRNAGTLQSAELNEASHSHASKKQRVIMEDTMVNTASDTNGTDKETGEEESRYILDPTTGLKIYPSDACAALLRFIQKVPSEDPQRQLSYKFQGPEGGPHVCKVKLPEGYPLSSVKGSPKQTVDDAKISACYRACKKLLKSGHLDYRAFPTPDAPAVPSPTGTSQVRSATDSAATRCYSRKSPSFWLNTISVLKDRLYPIIIFPGYLKNEIHAPMIIFTRLPLPELPNLTVFTSLSKATVRFQRGAPVPVDEAKLKLLHSYTMRIARVLLNTPVEDPLEDVPYFFAPLSKEWTVSIESLPLRWQDFPQVDKHILWKDMEIAVEKWAVPLYSGEGGIAEDDVHDILIQDRSVEFSHRHFVVKLRCDLNPFSKPADSPREADYPNLLEYCKARRKEFGGLKDEKQALIEVAPAPVPINHLLPSSKPDIPSGKLQAKYYIPELCYRCSVSASLYRTAVLLPSILHHIDRVLLAKEINVTFFETKLPENDILAALSPSAAEVEQNYERLELLGDTILKWVASTYVFCSMTKKKESALHSARQQIISNKALHMGALKVGLPEYIQSKPLIVKVWRPVVRKDIRMPVAMINAENDVKEDGDIEVNETSEVNDSKQGRKKARGRRKRQIEDRNIQWLGDKTVADVVEALIGVGYLKGGRDAALKVMSILNINLPNVFQWSDFSWMYRTLQQGPTEMAAGGALLDLSSIIGYTFKQPKLLSEALTHSSVPNAPHYERLEFLGDAVIESLAVQYAYTKYPDLGPGGLSVMKAALVSNATLAAFSVLSGLMKHLRCTSEVSHSVSSYAKQVRKLSQTEYKLAQEENRLPTQFWHEVEPPKVLSDIVESMIGAIFVDQDFEMDATERFFEQQIKPFFDKHIRLQTLSKNPITTLHELLQAEGCEKFSLRRETQGQETHCDVIVHDQILARGSDAMSNPATRKAAVAALTILETDPSWLGRLCDCMTQHKGRKTGKQKSSSAQGQSRLGFDEIPENAQLPEAAHKMAHETGDHT